jgi:hypothetical protein
MSKWPGHPATDRLSRLDEWLLPVASKLVPRERRADWAREWQAEFWHLRHGQHHSRRGQDGAVEILSLARGLVADAAWIGMNSLREGKRGSAQSCLIQLALSCVACGTVELIYAGSWRSLRDTFFRYFVGRFVLVALPAIFVALATMPRRPRKCNRGEERASGVLPAHARWNLFLIAKVALSLILGFLVCVLASIPVGKTLGHNGDWVDVMLSTVVLTTSLRLALDDQKHRCQRCLRLLRQPVRIGPPSYNLLDWNGTELVCADGHGSLQVPEMQGSWCWYDLWVELDPNWQTSFSSETCP